MTGSVRVESTHVGDLLVHVWRAAAPDAPVAIAAHGITANGLSWGRVAELLDGRVTLLAPDLRGRAGSRAAPGPYGIARHADDLAAILEELGVPEAVLVGHSMGGYVAAMTAVRHPWRATGVVLVDASHEDQAQFQPASVREEARGLRKVAPFVPLLRFFGVLRLRDRFQPATITGSKLSQADMQEVSALALRPNFLPAVLQEYASLPTLSANQVRSAGDLGNLPLMVLTAGQGDGDKDVDGFRQAWLDKLQPSLARLSRRGQQVLVQDSDHMIPYKDPEAIVRAIHSVWAGALR